MPDVYVVGRRERLAGVEYGASGVGEQGLDGCCAGSVGYDGVDVGLGEGLGDCGDAVVGDGDEGDVGVWEVGEARCGSGVDERGEPLGVGDVAAKDAWYLMPRLGERDGEVGGYVAASYYVD